MGYASSVGTAYTILVGLSRYISLLTEFGKYDLIDSINMTLPRSLRLFRNPDPDKRPNISYILKNAAFPLD